LADNLGIQAAVEISPAVTGVYVLDPALIHPPQSLPPMAPARLWFLLESLIELQQRWRAAGSRLLILEGDPCKCCRRWQNDSAPRLWSGTEM
jgi:deoxyribodipyrimidine photo-lyase